MIRVISKFAGTAIVVADAGAEHTVVVGVPVTFAAGAQHPDASYAWDFGDGATATGAAAPHTYVKPGFYVLKLAVTVNQPGGALTRDYGRIRVVNVPPLVEPLGHYTVDEGSVLKLAGRFTDPQWLDTHTATWYWGDDQEPSSGTVSEAHDAPLGRGEVTGDHAWGDNGEFTVTLAVQDEHGAVGYGTGRVTVKNVPPTVHGERDVFAYPCSPVTLRALFTDPGWLDRHTGSWDIEDGSPSRQAVIVERRLPPKACGVASVRHVFSKLGRYCCTCTVTDDDGGSGSGTVCVSVVDVVNRSFEDGFRTLLAGTVANGWTPYAASVERFKQPSHLLEPGPSSFAADEFVVCDGQRAQRIRATLGTRAGILQTIGANPDWEYEVSVRYWLDVASAGCVRLGLDPWGGTDATKSGVSWSEGSSQSDWSTVTVRVRAKSERLGIFVEALVREEPQPRGESGERPPNRRGIEVVAYVDQVRLVAMECCAAGPDPCAEEEVPPDDDKHPEGPERPDRHPDKEDRHDRGDSTRHER